MRRRCRAGSRDRPRARDGDEPDLQPESDREALRARDADERAVRRAAPQPRDRRQVSAGLDVQDGHCRGCARHGPLHARLAVRRSRLLRGVRQAGPRTPAIRRRPRVRQRQPRRPASSTRSTRSSATSARRSAPASCSTTPSASASTRCRRSRRRRASASRAVCTTTGDCSIRSIRTRRSTPAASRSDRSGSR